MKPMFLTVLLAATLALGACRSSSTKSSETSGVEASLVQLDPRVVGTGSSRALEFTLQNTADHAVTCAFTVDWLDANGAHVPLASNAWQSVKLDAGATQSVRVAPMPSEAKSWRLRFQSPER